MNKVNYEFTILTVNYNTAAFINIILYAVKQLNYYPTKVLIADNNSKRKDYIQLTKQCEKYDNVTIFRLNHKLKGSLAHGHALNFLCKKIDTPYFAILDSDATFLIKNWDKLLIDKLREGYQLIGTQSFNINRNQKFPAIQGIIIETATFQSLNIDFMPKDIQAGLDTGCELQEKYLSPKYSFGLISYKSTKEYKKGPFKDLICGEYYITGISQIVASHFERGATLGSFKYKKYTKSWLKYFYRIPILGKYHLKQIGMQEKLTWIAICKKIIDKQIP